MEGIHKKSNSRNHSTPINGAYVCKYLCVCYTICMYACNMCCYRHSFICDPFFFNSVSAAQVTIILRFLDRLRCQMLWYIHSLYGPYNFRSHIYCLCAATLKVRLLISIESCTISIFFHSFHVTVSRLWNASEGKR